jgi:site-specific recombinase XerD
LTSTEGRALGRVLPDARAQTIISLGVFEGLRRAEICGLELGDVSFATGTIRVVGKGGHQRDLPLTETTRYFLEQYMGEERGKGGGALIRSRTTGGHLTPSSLGHLVSAWMKEAGIKEKAWDGRSTHALRHSMAGSLYNRGVDLRTIASALGHASPTTTWVYLRHQHDLNMLRQVMGQPLVDEPVRQLERVMKLPYEMPRVGAYRTNERESA